MTRELVVMVTCDLDKSRVPEDEAVLAKMSWGGVDYEFDVCHECGDPSTWPVADLIAVARVIRPPSKGSTVGKIPCTVDGCSFKAKSEQGLAKHTTQQH